ncbi:MAG TPA: PEP-CTERM sorting domain-containing protein [Thermoguttaceae bacterium]|nr:PEP-CTERM sorting domain-containing protein [Thermoguttaceae bacterium]
MKYFALAMVAVLAMAGVSYAGYTVDLTNGVSAAVSDPIDLEFGKTAYTVTFYGTQAWRGLYVDGQVHQVFGGMAPAQTPYQGDLPGAVPPTINPSPYDTHFMFAASTMSVGQQTDGLIETCSTLNENGLTQDYTHYAGMLKVAHPGLGTFNTVGPTKDLAFAFTGEIPVAGYGLLYVVLEDNDLVYLRGQAANAAATIQVPVNVPIGVPEPGTIAMLIAGALCLFGIRRK